MKFINLNCCNTIYSTANESYRKIDRFKNANISDLKLKNGQIVKKEIILMSVCPVCRHYILKVLRYSSKSANFYNYDECLMYRGKSADNYWIKNCDNYVGYPLASPFTKFDYNAKQSRSIPFIFGKTLKCGTKQVPRYIDEYSDAGEIINSPLKIYRTK